MLPLTFAPHYRPQVWGGRRLESVLGKKLPTEGKFGEAWDLSAQTLHLSRVTDGPHAGQTIAEIWKKHSGNWLGPSAPTQFPLLIKWLDCSELLSVQVHPDDSAAGRLLSEPCGKTEAWIVLHAEPEAIVYAGLKHGVTKNDVTRQMHEGTVADSLHSFHPKRGDVIFIPAGTVHAAGGGIVMAEVQQTSDATFRMFDWNRPGPDGKPRQLHHEAALECIDWSQGPVRPHTSVDLVAGHTPGIETILHCPHFQFDIVHVGPNPLTVDSQDPTILMALEGELTISGEAGSKHLDHAATSLLPPAALNWQLSSPTGACCLHVHLGS
jgi:mannose-6-phosphate isomerase